MLDAAACRLTRATVEPVAALSALAALRALLSETLAQMAAASTGPASSALSSSRCC